MKIALYIEDGLEQIVLTPQSDVRHGFICDGDWSMKDDSSTMIVLRPKIAQ